MTSYELSVVAKAVHFGRSVTPDMLAKFYAFSQGQFKKGFNAARKSKCSYSEWREKTRRKALKLLQKQLLEG